MEQDLGTNGARRLYTGHVELSTFVAKDALALGYDGQFLMSDGGQLVGTLYVKHDGSQRLVAISEQYINGASIAQSFGYDDKNRLISAHRSSRWVGPSGRAHHNESEVSIFHTEHGTVMLAAKPPYNQAIEIQEAVHYEALVNFVPSLSTFSSIIAETSLTPERLIEAHFALIRSGSDYDTELELAFPERSFYIGVTNGKKLSLSEVIRK